MPKQGPSLEKMRHAEYARDEEWIANFLQQAQIGHVATQSGVQPYLIPTLFWYDPERHEIYFHSNIRGHIRSNAESHPQVCFETYRAGKPLPSNIALEFSYQYESVIAFGEIRTIEDEEEKERLLYGLIEKYFPTMTPGNEYRPITEEELKRTSVYVIAIHSWSGKRNWEDRADQGEEWPPLAEEWFE
jgi:nitroimidazol reductase NimA-like FMN-containing flavoprotein (pyridoxamine 5'-phosphate oxidase superfamily)